MTSSMPFDSGFNQGAGSEETAAPTGRYVVVLSDDVYGDESAVADTMRSVTGARNIASTSDFEGRAMDVGQAEAADATVFQELGIAVVAADPDRASSVRAAAAEDPRVLAVEPEQIMHALTQPEALPVSYLQGYRDAAENLYEHAFGNGATQATVVAPAAAQFVDTPALTWGLQATKVSTSLQNVQVAVLDTGFEFRHPDFARRNISHQSFVPGQEAQDRNGHGTHCVGTACGPQNPTSGRRYGVSYGSNIAVGKVLSDEGAGTDTNILAGMSWAIAHGSRVISMSLGSGISSVSTAYEVLGRRALAAGTLIVAAAGNSADRAQGRFSFVGRPANSPSIMAVAALDSQLRLANFSTRSNPVEGGKIDLVGPGVQVYSSWLMQEQYRTISGTSMATPHVAGIAALWSQRTGASGGDLWSLLVRNAQPLPLPAIDVGAGLVQALQ